MRSMEPNLVARREKVMDQADRALDKAWPERKGQEYVREMESAAKELESISAEMQASDIEPVEQSRARRYLGSIYADLAPALGAQMLAKSIDAYRKAEMLLAGCRDALEQARLDFNLGNTLRQLDPNNVQQLQEAERRFLSARSVFAVQATHYLARVDEALLSTRNLLRVAPVASAVEKNLADIKKLEQELTAGGDLAAITRKMEELWKRGGGPARLFADVERILQELPVSIKESDKYKELTEQMSKLAPLAVGAEESISRQDAKLLDLLKDRLKADTEQGRVTLERAKTLADALDNFGKAMAPGDDSLQTLMSQFQQMRAKTEAQIANLHYPSHGIERPPKGSRAAALVELCWVLRLFLLEEISRPGKSPSESKAMLDLYVRASEVDKRIYEAGRDEARASVVEKEAFRPLAIEIRNFAARHHPLLAWPKWSGARVPEAPDAVYFSGTTSVRRQVSEICRNLELDLMSARTGETIATARWVQLQKANTAIFDLSAPAGPDQAAVAYELGIALTLGKPVVVLASEDHGVPFDVDVEPVFLSGSTEDITNIGTAIDRSLVWTMPRLRAGTVANTIDYVLTRYAAPRTNTYVDQTLKQLEQLRTEPDPVAATDALRTLVNFLGDPMLIHSTWPPVYPESGVRRLFHVMPYRPKWADAVYRRVEELCTEASVHYRRGDQAEDPNVIRSIWEEISRATHVLVDLTGFSANVALELGIAHTLGRRCLLVGQEGTVERLFPMVAKDRFYRYEVGSSPAFDSLIREFIDR